MSIRLFETTSDPNPNTANRIVFGRPGFAALYMTLANLLTWLNANLTYPVVPDTITEEIAFSGWDMNANATFNVAFVLPANHEIVGMSAVIESPVIAGDIFPLNLTDTATGVSNGSVGIYDSAGNQIRLNRTTGGAFDNVLYGSIDGYVLVQYKDFS